jgi:hypothetical protein
MGIGLYFDAIFDKTKGKKMHSDKDQKKKIIY